jgi:hypothetical protein
VYEIYCTCGYVKGRCALVLVTTILAVAKILEIQIMPTSLNYSL